MIEFGVKTSQAREYGDYTNLRKVWIEAERLGFSSGWLFDHFFELPGIGPSEEPCLECWTALTALAAETKRLRLGVTVICAAYRNPALLAKMSSTLDVISSGRLEFGIGAGWASVEHGAYGFPFEKPAVRIAKLRETIKIVKMMWLEDKVSFKGKYYQIKDALNNPKPVQKPHPPMWIGGGGEQLTLRVVAELGDGCNFISLSPEEYTHKVDVLRTHCLKIGRDVRTIKKSWQGRILIANNEEELKEKTKRFLPPFQNINQGSAGTPQPEVERNIVGTPEQCIEKIAKYTDLGVSHFMLVFPEAPKDLKSLELFSEKVMPQFKT